VTSATGAVIEDIQTTLSRRHPFTRLLLSPALVQGTEAPASLIAALRLLEAVEEVDLIIIGRGGGSMEDLWCFNDETLVRAVSNCSKPVIAAIGHETDFTLTDFAADQRAPTPTAAAEMAAADLQEVKAWLEEVGTLITRKIENRFLQQGQWLDDMEERLSLRVEGRLKIIRQLLDSQETLLKASHFETILERGYTLTLKEGKVLCSSSSVQQGDKLTTRFFDGEVKSDVTIG
jgi:exodeoxyribonuclease VII large subunit